MSETLPEPLGCPWPIDDGCLVEWDSYDPAVQDRAVALASATLHRLTGYRVGNCPVTVRPCKSGCADGFVPFTGFPHGNFYPNLNSAGLWVNSCGCKHDCACTSICEVDLPVPVGRIDEVKVDGAIVDEADYRLDNGHLLVWTGDGACPWPACQNMNLADSEEGTFSVTYLNAYPVDGLGAYAAGMLANEFAKACMGNTCRLPTTVTALTRGGVSMEIESGLFPNGRTGMKEVDAYIGLWNPNGLQRQATVWTPDQHRPRVVG